MSVSEVVGHLQSMSIPERLEVIEAAMDMIRADLLKPRAEVRDDRDRRLRAAALCSRDLYEPGGDLTDWDDLDAEDFADDSAPG